MKHAIPASTDCARQANNQRSPWNLQDWHVPLLMLLAGVVFCQATWLAFLTPNEPDIVHYECYGLTFWLGSHGTALLPRTTCAFLFQGLSTSSAPSALPFHMLPSEYPPLTVLLFSLPLLVPLPWYALAFILMMTLIAGLVCWLLIRSDARQAAPIFLLYLLLGATGLFQERFDLLPATCTLVCVLSAQRQHWRVAYVALALGALLKLYPLLMLPALWLAEQHARPARIADIHGQRSWLVRVRNEVRRWHNCLLCGALLLAVMGSFALLNVQDALISPLHYFLARPIQIEALAGSLIWSASHLGVPYRVDFTFGSLNLESWLSLVLSPLATLLMLSGLLYLFWLQYRRRIDLLQAMVGLVCVLIATGKVFSPQYLIWLIPLLACLCARGQTTRSWMYCWAAISLLTTSIYIFYYSRLTDPRLDAQIVQTLGGFFELIMLRNVLVLGATVVFLGGWWGVRRPCQNAQT
jgi:hypothetical protein